MTFALQHCLLYPERAPGVEDALDFSKALSLDFAPVPQGRYPCLDLAFAALRTGPVAMAVFNAANEVAVADFLAGRIGFLDIPRFLPWQISSMPTAKPADSPPSVEPSPRVVK